MPAKKNNQRADRGPNKKRGNQPKLSPEEKKAQVAKELRISEKTKQFYDEVIDNKTKTLRQAYKNTHPGVPNDQQASVNASRLLNSEKYEIYKASVVGSAKRRVAELVKSDNESIALKASQDVIDRTEGKPTQRSESIVRTVDVKLDMSGLRIGSHYLPNDAQVLLPPETAET